MITTLLVDDNEAFVTLAVRMLAENFASEIMVVATAFNGEQGLLKAVALRPRLVLMDLIMPGFSGLQVIPTLREHSPQSYIIALSVLSSDGYRQAALDAGADAFMIKSQLGAALPAILRSLNGSDPALPASGAVASGAVGGWPCGSPARAGQRKPVLVSDHLFKGGTRP